MTAVQAVINVVVDLVLTRLTYGRCISDTFSDYLNFHHHRCMCVCQLGGRESSSIDIDLHLHITYLSHPSWHMFKNPRCSLLPFARFRDTGLPPMKTLNIGYRTSQSPGSWCALVALLKCDVPCSTPIKQHFSGAIRIPPIAVYPEFHDSGSQVCCMLVCYVAEGSVRSSAHPEAGLTRGVSPGMLPHRYPFPPGLTTFVVARELKT